MPVLVPVRSERPVASTTSSARVMRARSPGISRAAAAGSRRVEFSMQRRDAFARKPRAYLGADLRRDRRHGGEPARQRIEVEAGAADDDGGSPASRVGERRRGFPAPAPDRIVLRRIDMAVEPVRRARFLVRRRPRGDDAQVAIDLHGIGIDDGAAVAFRERSASADLPLAVGPAMRMMPGLLTRGDVAPVFAK